MRLHRVTRVLVGSHAQTALLVPGGMLLRRGVVVTDVPRLPRP